MSPTEQRPLTPEERKLLAEIPPLPSPFHHFSDVAVGSFGASGCLGLIATVAILALLGTDTDPMIRWIVVLTIVGLSTVVAIISATMRYSIARRKMLHTRSGILSDLAAGEARIERHLATAALRAIMEEHRERAYFMRLTDGRVLFIGFWNPASDDNPAEIQGMPADLPAFPSTEFEISRGVASGIVLGITFVGPPLPGVDTFEHRQGINSPQADVGEIVPVAWEDIRKTYG